MHVGLLVSVELLDRRTKVPPKKGTGKKHQPNQKVHNQFRINLHSEVTKHPFYLNATLEESTTCVWAITAWCSFYLLKDTGIF